MKRTDKSVQLIVAICVGIQEEGWAGDKDLGVFKRQLVVETMRTAKII